MAGSAKRERRGRARTSTPADLDLVAGLEALRLERPHHADPPQPPLEVGHRVLVLDVVAREQPLDAPAADGERAGPRRSTLKPLPRRGPEHHVLGELVLARELRWRSGRTGALIPGGRLRVRSAGTTRRSSSLASSPKPAPVALEVTSTGTSAPRRRSPGSRRIARRARRSRGRPSRARGSAAARASRGSWAASSRSIVAWLACASAPLAARRSRARCRARARAGACARRARGSRVRARRLRWRPRSARGCRRRRAGARRLRAPRAPAESVVKG